MCHLCRKIATSAHPTLRARASIAIAHISYGNSVLVSVLVSVCHDPVPFQDLVG